MPPAITLTLNIGLGLVGKYLAHHVADAALQLCEEHVVSVVLLLEKLKIYKRSRSSSIAIAIVERETAAAQHKC